MLEMLLYSHVGRLHCNAHIFMGDQVTDQLANMQCLQSQCMSRISIGYNSPIRDQQSGTITSLQQIE